MIVTDVVVVGGGIIGLAAARAIAGRGLSATVVAAERVGAASRASAGLLVPHYSGEGAQKVAAFMVAARDSYPAFVAVVEAESGRRVPLSMSGAIELANSAEDRAALWAAAPPGAERLLSDDVAALEPGLALSAGGLLYPADGAVDNVRLTDALGSICRAEPRIRIVREAARRLELDRARPVVVGDRGARIEGRWIVLAAGAWVGAIDGLPRQIPVRPLRGQICAIGGAPPIRHVVLSAHTYMVGRGGDRTLIGSTMEDAGFDARTTERGIAALRAGATSICPSLADRPIVDSWAGLRPATPDLMPIIGPDPEHACLLYACGHSRNGILLAPLTATVLAAIVAGDRPQWDLSPFSIGRFETARVDNRQFRL